MVREWSRLPKLDGVLLEGSVGSSNRTRKTRLESRQNCVNAPFTRCFANSIFQGRGTHVDEVWRNKAEDKNNKCAMQSLERESMQPVRLFSSRGQEVSPGLGASEWGHRRPCIGPLRTKALVSTAMAA